MDRNTSNSSVHLVENEICANDQKTCSVTENTASNDVENQQMVHDSLSPAKNRTRRSSSRTNKRPSLNENISNLLVHLVENEICANNQRTCHVTENTASNDVENQQVVHDSLPPAEDRTRRSSSRTNERPNLDENILNSLVHLVENEISANDQKTCCVTENTASNDVENQQMVHDSLPPAEDRTRRSSSRTNKRPSLDENISNSSVHFVENEMCANDRMCCIINLAVAPLFYPMEEFDNYMMSRIKKAILELIFIASQPDKPLIFNGSTMIEGAIVFQCANDHTVKWLKELSKLHIDNKDVIIRVIEMNQLSNCHRAVVRVKEDLSRRIILQLLNKQNKGLATHEWFIVEGSEHKNGNSTQFEVHCAIVFAEGVFEGETLVTHPNRPQGELEIALYPAKNDPVDIHVKVYVGPLGTDLLQVFEITRQLPRFCMYEFIPKPQHMPEGLSDNGVIADVAERPQRIAIWLNQSLILGEELEVVDGGCIEIWLRGMRDDKVHCFKSNASGKLTIQTDDSTFAGDIIQSLAMYLGVRELNSEATFPKEETRMLEALERVKDLKEIDARLQAEAAGSATLLKSIVIRLEDARILENIDDMRKGLMQLKNINGDLIREHEIRLNSHRELAASLKELNIGVQRAARLRVGKAASNAVARCRTAIQDENPKALALAIKHG
nr:PREDICTED: uncharacterized protein LOC105674990 [Linepithema humile]